MLRHIVFFIYIFGIFTSIMGIFIHWLLAKKKGMQNKEQAVRLRRFMYSTFWAGLVSFFTFYSQFIIFHQATNTAIRLLDYLFWACFIIYWINYLDSMVENRLLGKIKSYLQYWCLCYIVIWIFATSYIWDYNYYIISQSGRVLFILLDMMFCVLSVTVVLVYALRGLFRSGDRRSGLYILSVSAALTLYAIWELYHYVELFSGNTKQLDSVLHPFNATAFFLLYTNLITLIYLYFNEFSAAFLKSETKPQEDSTEQVPEMVFNTDLVTTSIAAEHNLTPREKEVMEFVFKGFNNAEIADELFISQNTVKHHVYNLFKKLNVNNRVELMCLLQEFYS